MAALSGDVGVTFFISLYNGGTVSHLQNLGVGHLDHGLYELTEDLKSCCGCSSSIFSLSPSWSIQVCVSLSALFNEFQLPLIGLLWREITVGTQVLLPFLSLMPLSFPVLALFSGLGGDDSAKKKVSVVMERVRNYSNEDKNSSFVFCLAVLNATTIH